MPSVARTARPRTRRQVAAPVSVLYPSSLAPSRQPVDSGRVAQRAYELFLARGGEHGRDLDDWIRAERELSPES